MASWGCWGLAACARGLGPEPVGRSFQPCAVATMRCSEARHCSNLPVLVGAHDRHPPAKHPDVLCALQVYRGIMRGVQDVAIKELIGTTEYQHASFRKVNRLTYAHHTHAQPILWHG